MSPRPLFTDNNRKIKHYNATQGKGTASPYSSADVAPTNDFASNFLALPPNQKVYTHATNVCSCGKVLPECSRPRSSPRRDRLSIRMLNFPARGRKWRRWQSTVTADRKLVPPPPCVLLIRRESVEWMWSYGLARLVTRAQNP